MADVTHTAFFDVEKLVDWSNFGQSFGVVSAIASLAALWGIKASYDGVKEQILAGRRNQLEINARETYTDYLKVALANPKFSSGYKADFEKKSDQFEQYEWYVSYMMNACEGILLHLNEEDIPYWKPTIKSQLTYHEEYFLKSDWFRENFQSHYSEDLCSLLLETCPSLRKKPVENSNATAGTDGGTPIECGNSE